MKDLPPMSPDPAASEMGSERHRIFGTAMTKRPQFSLAYLFLEIFWIAVALGLMTQAFRLPGDEEGLTLALLLLSAQAWGAAIGGLFHRMRTGFFFVSAVIIGVIVVLFLLTDGSILQWILEDLT